MVVSLTSHGVAANIPFDQSVDAPHFGFWRSIMPFGSEQTTQPVTQAFYEFDQALTAFSALHHAAKIQPDDRQQLLALRDEVVDIELEEFLVRDYKLLDSSTADSRTLTFSGGWVGADSYQINLGPLISNSYSNRIGRLNADFTLSKGSLSKDSAVLSSILELNMGTLLFREMLDSWEVFHRELERYAEAGVSADASMTSGKEGDWIYRPAASFDARDQLILQKLNESAPTVLALVNRLVTIDNIVDRPVEPFGQSMTPISIRHTIKLDALKNYYKSAYDLYGPIFEHLSLTTRLLTTEGTQIARIHYNADTKMFGFDMTISDGGIVLSDPYGVPTSETIYPTKLQRLDYSVTNDIFVDVFGLKIYIDHLTLNSAYSRVKSSDSDKAEVTMVLNQLPDIRVEGALLHFVPPWLIDVLIPGTIESTIAGAFSGAVNGRSGEGLLMALSFSEDNGQHQLSAGISVELRYQMLKDLMSGLESDEHQHALNDIAQPLIFKDLGEAVRKDFDALLLRHDMRIIGKR